MVVEVSLLEAADLLCRNKQTITSINNDFRLNKINWICFSDYINKISIFVSH